MSAMNCTYTALDTDAELSRLIGTLRLNAKVRMFDCLHARDEGDDEVKDSESTSRDLSMEAIQVDDLPRGSITSRPGCQSCSNTTSHSHAGPFGCPLLLSIHYHIEAYPTTGGAYIDTIFTHRALLHASPREHEGCSRAFSDLAKKIDDREWRADRESDQEAVTAFLHEAMTIANVY